MPPPADRTETASPGRGLVILLLVLLALSSLPLVSDRLPGGLAVLAAPRPVAVGSALVVLLFVFAVWPATGPRGRFGAVAVHGTLLFFPGATFVFVHALAAGAGMKAPLQVAGVLAAATILCGLHLAKSGGARHRVGSSGRDRGFALVVLLVSLGLPLVNYMLNEFGGISGELGYRLSPPLLIRRILLGLPNADPLPFFVLCLLLLAIWQVRRFLKSGAAAIVLLVLAGTVRSEELRVAPLLGDAYLPGRALPLLVIGSSLEVPPGVQVPGVARVYGEHQAGGTVLLLPAPADLDLVHVMTKDGWEERDLSILSMPFTARHLVSFTGVSDAFLDEAEMRLIAISRVHPLALSLEPAVLATALLSADGVLDPEGVLPPRTVLKLEAAGVPVLTTTDLAALDMLLAKRSVLRRIWEEKDTVLLPDGLFGLFPPDPGQDPERGRTALIVLAGFSLLFLAGVRFALKRRLNLVTPVLIAALASGWTMFLAVTVLPALPDWESRTVTAREGGRSVQIELLQARRSCTAVARGAMVLGRGALVRSDPDGMKVPLAGHEARIAVREAFGAIPGQAVPDVLFGPQGLRLLGEEPLPPTKFLKAHYPGAPGRPNPRALLLRKLIRLAEPPREEVGIRFPAPGRPYLDVVPCSE